MIKMSLTVVFWIFIFSNPLDLVSICFHSNYFRIHWNTFHTLQVAISYILVSNGWSEFLPNQYLAITQTYQSRVRGFIVYLKLIDVCNLKHLSFLLLTNPIPVFLFPAGIYLFKVYNRKTRRSYEICSKLTITARERCRWRRSGVFVNNFK